MNLQVACEQLKYDKSLPDNFEFFNFEIVQTEPSHITRMTGGMCRTITRGKKSGRKCWRGRDKGYDREFYITNEQYLALEKRWVERTGKCAKCLGTGKLLVSWHHIDGSTYRECHVCKGSTLAAQKEPTP